MTAYHPIRERKSENFQLDMAHLYSLRILLSETAVHVLVQHKETQSVEYLKEERLEEMSVNGVVDILTKLNLLKLPFAEEQWVLNTKTYTLLPQTLFDKDKVGEYVQMIDDFDAFRQIFVEEVKFQDSDIVVVNTFNKNILNFIQARKVENIRTYSNLSRLFERLSSNFDASADYQILVSYDANFCHVISLKSGQLHLANSYEYADFSDSLYYLKKITETFEVDLKRTKMLLMENTTSSFEKELKEGLPVQTCTVVKDEFAF